MGQAIEFGSELDGYWSRQDGDGEDRRVRPCSITRATNLSESRKANDSKSVSKDSSKHPCKVSRECLGCCRDAQASMKPAWPWKSCSGKAGCLGQRRAVKEDQESGKQREGAGGNLKSTHVRPLHVTPVAEVPVDIDQAHSHSLAFLHRSGLRYDRLEEKLFPFLAAFCSRLCSI